MSALGPLIGAVVLLLAICALWVRLAGSRRDYARLLKQHQELAAHAQLLLEQSCEPMLRFDGKGLIRNVNPAAEELFGYREQEVFGQSILLLVPDAPSLPTGRGSEIEVRCKNGSRTRLKFRAAKAENDRQSHIYLYFDSSTAVQTATVPEPQSSGTFLAAIGRIAGRIASQFEGLLTTINGYGELALHETPVDSPIRQDLEEIVSASERASNLTQSLMAFTGNQMMPLELVDLNQVVRGMDADLRGLLAGRLEIRLEEADRATPGNVECLRQLIFMLCQSALLRMRETDRVLIATGSRELSDTKTLYSGDLSSGTYSVLTIFDSGAPLSTRTKAHLFEPLYLDPETVGLELSPIYGMVHSLGGGIEMTSETGRGTTFEIWLPSVAVPKPQPPLAVQSAAGRR